MGNLVFQATLGGQVNLVGPNTASTFNLNVPAVAGTLVTTGDTGTVTNTMCATSVYTAPGTIGSGTPNTGAFTTLTTTSTINNLTVGRGAGSVSTNTAVGASALATNSTGAGCTAIGYTAANVSTGDDITAVGTAAALLTTTGNNLVAVGTSALRSNTSGAFNTALGRDALRLNTTGANQVAIGYQAGYSQTTGGGNGGQNVFIGDTSGLNTTSDLNTFVGRASGYLVTTGRKNTILGGYNGNQGGLDIRTGNNYIVLSDGDGNPRGYYNGAGSFWGFNNGGAANSTVLNVYNDNASSPYGQYISFSAASPNNTTYYFLGCNDSTTSCFRIWSNGTTSGRSDSRLKKNIVDATPKLADICQLQVRNYEWNESIDGHKEIGLIAQEVETVFPGLVVTHDLEKDGDDYKEVKYSAFVPILIKALQELKAEFDAYKEAHP